MAKFVCLLVCLAALVSTGFSLDCYKCNSEKIDGCVKGAAGSKEQKCGNAGQGQKSVCYYKESHDANKKMDFVNATCALIPEAAKVDKSSLTDCAPSGQGITVKECRVCDSNLCNSAPVFSTSLSALLCLPLMYFVTKFLL